MPHNTHIRRVLTDKSDVSRTQLDTQPMQPCLAEGEILLKIQRLALTTNNITYAAFGDAMQYWQFFPTGVEDWGHMPAWGFADVVQTKAPGLAVGERFFGYSLLPAMCAWCHSVSPTEGFTTDRPTGKPSSRPTTNTPAAAPTRPTKLIVKTN